MADQDVIIAIGSSNMAGFLANLYDVPNVDFMRWVSQNTPTALTPTRPYSATVPGVRMWTPRRPFSLNEQRTVTAVGGGDTTVTFASSAITSPAPAADMWQFVKSGTGRGNIRRITAVAGAGPWTHTVNPANSPAIAVGDTLAVLQDSRTLASLSSDGLTATQTAASPALTSSDVGRFALFFDVAAGTETTRKIASVDIPGNSVTFDLALSGFPAAATATTITFDGATERVNFTAHGFVAGRPVVFAGGTPPVEVVERTVYYVTNVAADTFQLATTLALALAGTNFTLTGSGSGTTTVQPTVNGFCILSGANSCSNLATLTNAVLQDLTFVLDEVSPVFLTGLDYTNWDFTAFVSPRNLSYDPTINSVAELSWQVRSKTGRPLVVLQLGVSASMISPFVLAPSTAKAYVGPIHDLGNLDFHPSSPSVAPHGIYPILTGAIASLQALITAEGNTAKIRGIFINLFDNEGQDAQRVARIGANTVLLRDTLRTLLDDDDIPWIMSGPSAYAGGPGHPNNTSTYRQLFQVAADDPESGVVDTRYGYTYCTEDSLHLSAFSQIRLARDFFRVWEPIHDRLVGPKAEADLVKIAMCNRALTAIGETPNITSLDPPEGSVHADKCLLLFDQAAEFVTSARHWTHADRRVALEKVRLDSPNVVDAGGGLFSFNTATPHGFSIGSPLSFAKSAAGTGTVPTPLVAGTTYYVAEVKGPNHFTVTSTVGGYGTVITLTSVGTGEWRCFKESDRDGSAYMYALPEDCFVERAVVQAGSPDDWPGMDGSSLGRTELGSGFVTATVSGLNQATDATMFGARQPVPFKRAKNAAGEMVIYTNLDAAELVYTARLDDATQWPPDWRQAVEMVLTSYLCASVKRDLKGAREYMQMAQFAISDSARLDSQRQPNVPQNRFPFAR